MMGFIYRRAIGLKDFGERRRIGFIVRLGLAVRDWVYKVNLPFLKGKKIKAHGGKQ